MFGPWKKKHKQKFFLKFDDIFDVDELQKDGNFLNLGNF